jgi:hypothetical protein
VSFAAVALCVASEQVFIVVVCFVIDSVRKLLDTPSYNFVCSRSWGNILLDFRGKVNVNLLLGRILRRENV